MTQSSNCNSSTGFSVNSTLFSNFIFLSTTSSLGPSSSFLFSSSDKSESNTLNDENSVIYPDNALCPLSDVYDINNELYIFNNI